MNKEKALFVTRKGALRTALKVCRAKGMTDTVIVAATKLHKVIKRGQMMGYGVTYTQGVLVHHVYESEV